MSKLFVITFKRPSTNFEKAVYGMEFSLKHLFPQIFLEKLEKIIVPKKVIKIGKECFENCINQTTNIIWNYTLQIYWEYRSVR